MVFHTHVPQTVWATLFGPARDRGFVLYCARPLPCHSRLEARDPTRTTTMGLQFLATIVVSIDVFIGVGMLSRLLLLLLLLLVLLLLRNCVIVVSTTTASTDCSTGTHSGSNHGTKAILLCSFTHEYLSTQQSNTTTLLMSIP